MINQYMWAGCSQASLGRPSPTPEEIEAAYLEEEATREPNTDQFDNVVPEVSQGEVWY